MLVYRVTAALPTNNRVVIGGILNQDLSFESAKNIALFVGKNPLYKDSIDVQIEYREVTPWKVL